ncbi:hypothetical protein AYL20_09300 [Acinetobacter venetianus]|uniref:hypothetical protein n=1 Tax=Acinetobacter venetianus TaxID=52133 RepID=UPI000775737F|nr:hypothetical protein [Acinetobacter venetianus]KXO76949.1 hypothetical protein AYL20_09300 [Acinetobacter venetianus]
MNKHDFAICVSIAFLTCNIPAQAKAPNTDTLGHNDYSKKMNWLCWPGKIGNACNTDMRTTVIQADGSTSIEHFKANAKAPIDCF